MFKALIIMLGMLFSVGSALAQSLSGTADNASANSKMHMKQDSEKMKTIAIVLFPGFETLDVFGPVQMWGRLPDHKVVFVAEKAGPVRSSQGQESIATYSFADAPQFNIVMVPGGGGARKEVINEAMLEFVRKQDKGSELTVSVCTGAAILAKAGLLDGHKATTNKLAYKWATSQSDKVNWVGHARWVVDGKYVTSSGVSAGTDMALALVEKIYGREAAEQRAKGAEYIWNSDANNDQFAVEVANESKK
jgi:putative intracellular protease/amidase